MDLTVGISHVPLHQGKARLVRRAALRDNPTQEEMDHDNTDFDDLFKQ